MPWRRRGPDAELPCRRSTRLTADSSFPLYPPPLPHQASIADGRSFFLVLLFAGVVGLGAFFIYKIAEKRGYLGYLGIFKKRKSGSKAGGKAGGKADAAGGKVAAAGGSQSGGSDDDWLAGTFAPGYKVKRAPKEKKEAKEKGKAKAK